MTGRDRRRIARRFADHRAVRRPRNWLESRRRTVWPAVEATPGSVAVVVVNYQTRRLTAQLIFSLCRIVGRSSFAELLVVDNASTDDSVEYLGALRDAGVLHLLIEPRQRYHGPALNDGLSWLARERPGTEYVLVVDSDVVALRPELIADGVAAMRASGAALGGQLMPGSPYVPLPCLLMDPRQAWASGLPPFYDDGAPSDALQDAVRAAGLGVADIPYGIGTYALHLGAGTLGELFRRGEFGNRFYGWARANHDFSYSSHPLGPWLHERFLELYAGEVAADTPAALVHACLREERLTIPEAQPLPPLEELAELAEAGVDLETYLLERS